MIRRLAPVMLLLAVGGGVPPAAEGYSVVAHEALVDSVWEDGIVPLLRAKYPRATEDDIRAARAYAYGGSLIQDLGYYPFGSRLFSNLLHYVRSGDFVEALVRDARDPNEYAFALGALAHYVADNAGHSLAVNRAIPLVYPKLRQKHGDEVLYAHSRSRHVMVEFAFDVVQVGRGAFKPDVYQELIGFEVAAPLLERAFVSTYGLELRDLFGDVELAIGTYRRVASRVLPDVTRLAWQEKRDDILAATPGITESTFVLTMPPSEYDQAFGTKYRKPGLLSRIVVALFRFLPKFGPFKPLAFEPLTPDAERMFLDSFHAAQKQFLTHLQEAGAGGLALVDTDLDTGAAATGGVNPLADETYDDLLEALASHGFATVPPELRTAINAHYQGVAAGTARKRDRKTARHLVAVNQR